MTDHVIRYSYADSPTLKRFSESDAFIRGVCGPFGCLSADHEVLTRAGWIRIDQWTGQEILVSSDRGATRFEVPQHYIREPCDWFYHFKARGIDQMLSPEHRILHFKKFNPSVARIITAEQAVVAHQQLADGWDGMVPCSFSAPPNVPGIGLSDADLRVMAMVCADGNFPSNSPTCAVVVRKDRKKERVRTLLKAAGIIWKERIYDGRPTESQFIFAAPERNKRLSAYWHASPDQLRVIADEVRFWDGMEDGGYGDWRYFSTNKEDADFAAYAFTTQGRRTSTFAQQPAKEHWKPCHAVAAASCGRAGFRYAQRKAEIARVPSPDGFKYCFNTSTGFFVTRRGDCITITGNSGKSSACVIEIIKRATRQAQSPDAIRRTRWVVVRNTFGQLADTTQKTFLDWIPPHLFGTWKPSEHHYLIDKIPGCEIEVLFRALDRPDHVRNLLSLEVTGAWVNEAREIPWSIIEALQGRVGRFPSKRDGGASWHGIIMDTNPPDADSKWFQFFEELRPPNAAIFRQPSGLSPLAENKHNLPDGYYENLALGKDPEWVKVYIHGEYGFVIDGKPVYPEYSDGTHCREIQPIPGQVIYRGHDFGLTPACCFLQISPKGQLLILDELVADNMGAERFADQVNSYSARNWAGYSFEDVGDPAGNAASQTDEKTCFQIYQAKGIAIQASPTQDPTLRIEAVKKPLNTMIDGQPGLLLHPRCKMLRKGFQGGYQYRRLQTSAEKYGDKPEKNAYSHPHDSLQYPCVKLFGAALTAAGEQKKVNYRTLYR